MMLGEGRHAGTFRRTRTIQTRLSLSHRNSITVRTLLGVLFVHVAVATSLGIGEHMLYAIRLEEGSG